MAWIAVTMGTIAAVGAYSADQAANAAAEQGQAATMDRFQLQGKIAEQMLQEQQSNVFEQMTDINRQFLQAKGKMAVMQAESGATGKTAQRLAFQTSAKTSEARGKIMKEAETNAVNIANDMLGKTMDAQAQMQKLENQKKSNAAIIMNAGMAFAGGAAKGHSLGSAFGSLSGPASTGVQAVGANGMPSNGSYANVSAWENDVFE